MSVSRKLGSVLLLLALLTGLATNGVADGLIGNVTGTVTGTVSGSVDGSTSGSDSDESVTGEITGSTDTTISGDTRTAAQITADSRIDAEELSDDEISNDNQTKVNANADARARIGVNAGLAIGALTKWRENVRAREDNALNMVATLRLRLGEAKADYAQAKSNWMEFRNKIRSNADYDHNRAFQAAKNLALHSTNQLYVYLEHVKTRANIQLDSNEAVQVNQRLDAQLVVLANWRTQIEAMTDANQLNAARDEIVKAHVTAKATGASVVGLLLVQDLEKQMEYAQSLRTNISSRLADWDANGYSTTEIRAQLTEFDAKMALAEEKIVEANAAFSATATTEAEVNAHFNDGKQALVDARRYVRDAYQDLREAIRFSLQEVRRVKIGGSVSTDVQATTAGGINA